MRDLVPFVKFKKREKHPRRTVLLVKLQGSACKFTKSNTPPWVFFTFFKLYKWYQIVQRITFTYYFLCFVPIRCTDPEIFLDIFERCHRRWIFQLHLELVTANITIFCWRRFLLIPQAVPHETLICPDRDPTWINKKKVKQLVIAKQNTYKFYTENKKDTEIFNRSWKSSKLTDLLNCR